MHKLTSLIFILGRLVVGGFYLYAGIDNLLNLDGKIGYAAYQGVPLPMLSIILASSLLLIGGMSILSGYRPTIGVATVILFLVPVNLLMHDFWSVADPQMRMIEMRAFQGNVALIGSALLLLGVPQPWAWSLDNMAATGKATLAKAMEAQRI